VKSPHYNSNYVSILYRFQHIATCLWIATHVPVNDLDLELDLGYKNKSITHPWLPDVLIALVSDICGFFEKMPRDKFSIAKIAFKGHRNSRSLTMTRFDRSLNYYITITVLLLFCIVSMCASCISFPRNSGRQSRIFFTNHILTGPLHDFYKIYRVYARPQCLSCCWFWLLYFDKWQNY